MFHVEQFRARSGPIPAQSLRRGALSCKLILPKLDLDKCAE